MFFHAYMHNINLFTRASFLFSIKSLSGKMDSNNPVVYMMILLATTFTYVNVPTTVMRDEPFHKAKVVSQAVFSEQVKVLEESGDWIKIETQIDRYQGWINK